jgi:hypothetical protein
MCIGKKVRFMPTKMSQKLTFPSGSLSSFPKIFGHQ